MEVLLPLLLTLPPAALGIIGVALGLSIMIVAVLFTLAYALQNPQMIAMAREELAALIFSVFIIMFWVGSDSFFNTLSSGLLAASLPPEYVHASDTSILAGAGGSISSSHLNLALATLDIFKQKLLGYYFDLFLFEALIGFLSTVSFPIGSPVPAVNIISLSLAPFTGLTLLSNAHTVIVETIGYLIALLWGKEFLVYFARDAVPLLFLPIGLVLRALPLFRRTGSSIIAVCFAMYFVLPFAIILSNYLIFDVYKPADFTYNPQTASYFGTDRDQGYLQQIVTWARGGTETNELMQQYSAPSLVEQASGRTGEECAGNFIWRMICSASSIVTSGISLAGSFFNSVWNIWRFMVGMSGDFFWTAFNNPLMPSSASAGLFHFLIKEVVTISPFVILVTLSTVMEAIITITAYRSISLLIGGEAELVGLTKVV